MLAQVIYAGLNAQELDRYSLSVVDTVLYMYLRKLRGVDSMEVRDIYGHGRRLGRRQGNSLT